VLYIDISVGDMLKIGDVKVTLTRKSGKKAQLGVDADPNIVITQYVAYNPPDKKLTLNKHR